MQSLLFQLGNTPELSLAELNAVTQQTPEVILPGVLVRIANAEQSAQELMNTLGGSVKVLTQRTALVRSEVTTLETQIAQYIDEHTDGKIHFSLAEQGRDHLPKLSVQQVKNQLQDQGRSVRFVEGSRHGLSASVLLHQKVSEYWVVQTKGELFLAETLAVQDIDAWSKRDRQKPYADRKKGMLPPKVARMMVNLALKQAATPEDVLLDPFCGSGTVLMEAALRGVRTVGSDTDAAAVSGSQENLAWLTSEYSLDSQFSVLQADAAKVTPVQPITHLVTEPFLGKPRPNAALLPNIYRGLEKLYLGAFKHWRSFLADGAHLVVVFPLVELPGKHTRRFSLEGLIDKLESLGYTTLSEPVLYHRPQAIVQRQIYQFVFKK